jgi:hypothetical protein
MRIGVSSNFAKENGVAVGKDSVIKSLQKQIESVQKQIAELSGNTTMDSKQKQEKKTILESEIQSLQQQIEQERKAEQEKESQAVKNRLAQSSPISSENKNRQIGFSGFEMQAIISASTAMEKATSVNHSRKQMIGKAGVLKGEIAATKSRKGNAAELEGKLSNLQIEINGVTSKIIAKYGEANKFMNDAFSMEKVNNTQMKNPEIISIHDENEVSKIENKITKKQINVKA